MARRHHHNSVGTWTSISRFLFLIHLHLFLCPRQKNVTSGIFVITTTRSKREEKKNHQRKINLRTGAIDGLDEVGLVAWVLFFFLLLNSVKRKCVRVQRKKSNLFNWKYSFDFFFLNFFYNGFDKVEVGAMKSLKVAGACFGCLLVL